MSELKTESISSYSSCSSQFSMNVLVNKKRIAANLLLQCFFFAGVYLFPDNKREGGGFWSDDIVIKQS